MSVYAFSLPLGSLGAGVFGIFAGVFVGAWAMALTEIINIIPIFARRLDLAGAWSFWCSAWRWAGP